MVIHMSRTDESNENSAVFVYISMHSCQFHRHKKFT
uniref:Uncharacterized protein n=1 Tax=Rhizophora mucronata TaxID=61149 RepID=A0A2P2IVP7_RHIMU